MVRAESDDEDDEKPKSPPPHGGKMSPCDCDGIEKTHWKESRPCCDSIVTCVLVLCKSGLVLVLL